MLEVSCSISVQARHLDEKSASYIFTTCLVWLPCAVIAAVHSLLVTGRTNQFALRTALVLLRIGYGSFKCVDGAAV